MRKFMKRFVLSSIIVIAMFFVFIPTLSNGAITVTATPTAQPLLFGANMYECDAYNINGYNYFKLRDIAFILSSSTIQFSVGWDESKKAITLTKGESYVETGYEYNQQKGTTNVNAITSTDIVYVADKKVELEAYNINGYNYFKLRDIGNTSALNFAVEYYEDTNSIVIYDFANPKLEILLYKAKPAIVIKDSKITNTYSIWPNQNGKVQIEKYDNLDRTFKKGEVVIVTQDKDGLSRIMSIGDAPALRGFLETSSLSFDSKQIDEAMKASQYPYDINSYKIVIDIT